MESCWFPRDLWRRTTPVAPGQGVAPQPAAPLLWSAAQAQELRLGFC